ncbi:MAG: HD domain-containing protein [Alphaproteobacteria bacterium]|nr:HD domain-containing protein [Alphaproteobacteria bacterium]
MGPIDAIFSLLLREGGRRYGEESVSQLAHALQAATLAEAAGAPPALITAALLHDLGHLLGLGDEGMAGRGIDQRHEHVAADHLARAFAPDVTEPIRLHVDAKRYLCAVDPGYFGTLSPASVTSLGVQGGPFTTAAAEAFARRPEAITATRVRRWDEAAKDPAARTPGLDHFRAALAACRRLHPA